MDETIFKDAFAFKPERWLGDDFNELDKHMISFSRGSRSCLGIKYEQLAPLFLGSETDQETRNSLAYSNLYLTFSQLVLEFKLTPFETDAESMVWKDQLTPQTKEHLRVTLEETAA